MAIFRRRPVRVQPYFGYRSRGRLTLVGRTQRSRAPEFEQAGRWRTFRVMMSQFFASEVRNVRVTLCLTRADGEDFNHVVTSDDDGYFRFDVPLEGDWPYPPQTAWEVVRLGWENADGHQSVTGHVLVPGEDAQIGVISDIDDTIIETGITGGIHNVVRNWKRIFAQMPQDRILVKGADAFYGAIGGGLAVPSEQQPTGSFIPATHRPFFYISSSPWNLFSYLVAFQQSRGLPLGALFATGASTARRSARRATASTSRSRSPRSSTISRTCASPSSATIRRGTCPPSPRRSHASLSGSRRCSSARRKKC